MSEKPLRVRVAEALGWTECEAMAEPYWSGRSPGEYGNTRRYVPCYDTDWAVTGPLIERFKLDVWHVPFEFQMPPETSIWRASHERSGGSQEAATLLGAVCAIIILLDSIGELSK